MIEVKITDKMLLNARKKSVELGTLNNSISNGRGNIYGFCGEEIALKIIKGEFVNNYNYDIKTETGLRVDVKTKATSAVPLPHYDCSIANLNTKQKCDLYAFVRVHNDLGRGWYLGHLPKKQYFEAARFLKKGQKDGDNRFTVRSDCYNVKISELSLDMSLF